MGHHFLDTQYLGSPLPSPLSEKVQESLETWPGESILFLYQVQDQVTKSSNKLESWYLKIKNLNTFYFSYRIRSERLEKQKILEHSVLILVFPRSSDTFYTVRVLYKMGHYFLDTQYCLTKCEAC